MLVMVPVPLLACDGGGWWGVIKPPIDIMKKTLSTTEAALLLLDDDFANWSPAGAYALVEWLEELEESTGEDMELDRIALRCEFSEYSSLKDWVAEYTGVSVIAGLENLGIEFEDSFKEVEQDVRDYVHDRGTLIEFRGGIIVSSF